MKTAIYGYGNLGRGVEAAMKYHTDCELVGVFTRRPPESVKTVTEGIPVLNSDSVFDYVGKIDVLILCGGSATDLPETTPRLAEYFNVVDSFDTHARIPEHFKLTDEASKRGGRVSLISGGWDPGLFSIARAYSSAVLPNGRDYTFWGRGISQGHSDAIRRIEGVLDARQYTVPVSEAIMAVRSGSAPDLTTREKHKRECYVVPKVGADLEKIREAIVTMPNYFADYDTTVTFISEEELRRNHSGMPHGGSVIRSGSTGFDGENKHTVEFSLKLDSNPEFTASVLVCCARAVYKASLRGECGCKTVLDIPPADFSALSPEQLRAHLL